MTLARKRQICLKETPYYHCVSRCVRRAFLCGLDPLTGRSYEHRREWVSDLLKHNEDIQRFNVCQQALHELSLVTTWNVYITKEKVMTLARKRQICLKETPYYHCVSRCVRRAFLCGLDPLTGRSYEHRREWVSDLLKYLADTFAIDICAYAVMHNHTHTVVKVDQQQALAWSREEVITRWTTLYKPSPIVARFLDGLKLSKAEMNVVEENIEKWRHRLYDISWFMRNLNETIARRANEEDHCTGRFWEGRFKSQALLDEAALLTCMSYVDLNPIRAGIADTPENSDFTSIQERIRHYHKILNQAASAAEAQISAPNNLLPFVGGEHQDKDLGLCFSLTDYLELTDWAGRAIREGKLAAIPAQLAPILERLDIDPEAWLDTVQNYNRNYYTVVGTREASKDYSLALGRNWFCLTRSSSQLYRFAS